MPIITITDRGHNNGRYCTECEQRVQVGNICGCHPREGIDPTPSEIEVRKAESRTLKALGLLQTKKGKRGVDVQEHEFAKSAYERKGWYD